MAEVVLDQVTKVLGHHTAVKALSLTIHDGEALALLGPSGCGKTTTLNMLAGFLDPDGGTIAIDGSDLRGVPPHSRNMGMVFQNYALFPHMTVAGNIAFGLEMRKLSRGDIQLKVQRAMDLVHLSGYEDRYPKQLSGGQQQRVALARALAIEPSVLLLDEPLSNLDAKLRAEVREEIAGLHRRTGVTMVFVTHDQDEALVIADRIAVMDQGSLQQVEGPEAVYRRPANRFVASFVGVANFFRGVLRQSGPGRWALYFDSRSMEVGDVASELAGKPEGIVDVLVRPEAITLTETPEAAVANCYAVTVQSASYLGSQWRVTVRLGDADVIVTAGADRAPSSLQPGVALYASWASGDARAVPPSVSPAGEAAAQA